jgi:hypothetical protein
MAAALASVSSGGIVAAVAALAGGTGLLMVTKEMAGAANELNALRDDAADGVALHSNPISALRDRSG